MMLAIALGLALNEDPRDLARRMFDALDTKQSPALFEMIVREERMGYGLDAAEYRKLLTDYVFPALGKPTGEVTFEEFDGRTNKLYGTWHYPYELDAKRSYPLVSGRTVTISLGIISTPQGYRVSGLVNALVEAVMMGKQLPSAKPSSTDLMKARFEGAKQDGAVLSRLGVVGVWKSPRTGMIPWERYLAEQRKMLSRAGVEIK